MEVPHGQTAQRLRFADLPGVVRQLIEERLGAAVVSEKSQGSGFTPGMASRLQLDSGAAAFVKAASSDHEWPVAHSYREEIRKLSLLPRDVPAPRLRWHSDDGTWVVLCFDDVAGRPPRRPWQTDELTRVLDTLAGMATALTPAPAGQGLPTVADELAEEPARWSRLRHELPIVDVLAAHLDEAEQLAWAALEATAGETLVHLDLRDDNVIIGDDGKVWICDWNWPAVGARWIDLVTVLISAYGDGHDSDALLSGHPVGQQADRGAVDALLSLLYGYFVTAANDPVPPWSPYIRIHQRWYADATLRWLAQRQGWS